MKKTLISLLVGLAAMSVIALAIVFVRLPGGAVKTSPKLVTDRTQIDLGQQPYGNPVKAVFRLRNNGDQPLIILGEPQVEVVKGC